MNYSEDVDLRVPNSIPCCEGCCCTCGSDFPLPCECHGDLTERLGEQPDCTDDSGYTFDMPDDL